jgi:hypothetical protein
VQHAESSASRIRQQGSARDEAARKARRRQFTQAVRQDN